MDQILEWRALAYEAGRLAISLGLVLLFLIGLSWLVGRGLKDLARFLKTAAKVELTEKPGWLDFAVSFLFASFIYVPSVSEQIFAALGIARLTSDPALLNSDLKALLLFVMVVFSLVFVGLMSKGRRG